mgnify:CR=1 FL=1
MQLRKVLPRLTMFDHPSSLRQVCNHPFLMSGAEEEAKQKEKEAASRKDADEKMEAADSLEQRVHRSIAASSKMQASRQSHSSSVCSSRVRMQGAGQVAGEAAQGRAPRAAVLALHLDARLPGGLPHAPRLQVRATRRIHQPRPTRQAGSFD